MQAETREHLHRQLVKLGDMMGDGLHKEPDGKWIEREYRKVMVALGMIPKRKNNSSAINQRMAQRVKDVSCKNCGGQLKQTRSGSKRAACVTCFSKWQLLR